MISKARKLTSGIESVDENKLSQITEAIKTNRDTYLTPQDVKEITDLMADVEWSLHGGG